jgi:hypothetical protein
MQKDECLLNDNASIKKMHSFVIGICPVATQTKNDGFHRRLNSLVLGGRIELATPGLHAANENAI